MTFSIQDFKTTQEKADKAYKFMFGNGEVGMDEHIRNIMAWIKTQEDAAARRRAWWDKLQWVIIPVGIAGVITFIGQAYVFYTRIVPLVEAANK